MNSNNDELVKMSALGLVELANYAGIIWDEIYLMYQQDEFHTGGTETYRKGRELKFLKFEFGDKKAEVIKSKIWSTLEILFNSISINSGKSPSACVVTVTSDYNFKIKFGYGESEGMSIRLLDLGKPQSFYDLAIVDIPQSIRKAQEKGL